MHSELTSDSSWIWCILRCLTDVCGIIIVSEMIIGFVLMVFNFTFVSTPLPDPHIYLSFFVSVPRIFLLSREATIISTVLVSLSNSKIAGPWTRNYWWDGLVFFSVLLKYALQRADFQVFTKYPLTFSLPCTCELTLHKSLYLHQASKFPEHFSYTFSHLIQQ